MVVQDRQPYSNSQHDAAFQFFGCPTVIRSTGETTDNHFFLMESLDMPVGLASPYHVHHDEDEAFYVLDGELAVVLDARPLHLVVRPSCCASRIENPSNAVVNVRPLQGANERSE
jgi:mannose-6-phosphate isomerase-like protein (cupin superfamily)